MQGLTSVSALKMSDTAYSGEFCKSGKIVKRKVTDETIFIITFFTACSRIYIIFMPDRKCTTPGAPDKAGGFRSRG